MGRRWGELGTAAVLLLVLAYAVGITHMHAMLYLRGVPHIGTVTTSRIFLIDRRFEEFRYLDDGNYTSAPMGARVREVCVPRAGYCEEDDGSRSPFFHLMLRDNWWGLVPLAISLCVLTAPALILGLAVSGLFAPSVMHVLRAGFGRRTWSSLLVEVAERLAQVTVSFCVAVGVLLLLLHFWPVLHRLEGPGVKDALLLGGAYLASAAVLMLIGRRLIRLPIDFAGGMLFPEGRKVLGAALTLCAGAEIIASFSDHGPATPSDLLHGLIAWLHALV